MSDQRQLIESRIKNRRKQSGMTLEEMENKTGITNCALSKVESSISTEHLYAIS